MLEDRLASTSHQSRQATYLWAVFFLSIAAVNGTIFFVFGYDLKDWTNSLLKSLVIHLFFYAGLFLVIPLIVVKGWDTVRQPGFLIPLIVAVVGIALTPFVRLLPILAIVVLAYLHRRYDLSAIGFRSRGWKGDVAALLLLALLQFLPLVSRVASQPPVVDIAVVAGLGRLFTNPASTVENLFYFGFLTERLSSSTGRWLTPFLIGAMYTAHEMSNPEYWDKGLSFVYVFVGITVMSAVYLWRRNIMTVWLGDGLVWFVSHLY